MEKKLKNAIIMNRLTKIMFVLGFLLTSMWSYSSNSVYAQNQKFSFEFKQTSIKTIFQYIEKHSEFIFMYRTDLLDTSKKVSVKVEKQSIEQILEQVLKGTSVVYEINDRQILLKKDTDKKQSTTQNKKKKTIHGIVTDELSSESIIGASIKIKGVTTGTTTDINGSFTLNCMEGDTLVISYIGYKEQLLRVKSVNVYNIVLKEATEDLEEVVVTAFGVGQKKESMVGAVSQIKSAELRIPTANLSSSFAGRLSGVTAYQSSGEPGNDGSTFYIRGISTFTATSPLIVIDGVEASSGDLNALDPEVIESFSILKDATATAMYGTRGANGVMIVNTKSGANLEKAAISARVEAYVSMPNRLPKYADGVTYMELYNEAATNYGVGGALYSQDKIEGTRAGVDPYLYPNVDWYDEIFKDASFNQRVNFNVRGGSQRIDYFVNANVNHETGMIRGRSSEFYSYDNNVDIMRYTLQTNINAHLTKTATLSMNLGVELRDEHGPATDADTGNINYLFSSVSANNPVDYPTFFPIGSSVNKWGTTSDYVKWGGYNGGNVAGGNNPLAELTKGYRDTFESTVRANIRYKQKLDFITKGLSFNALLSFKNWSQTWNRRQRSYNRYYVQEGNGTDYLLNLVGNTTESNSTLTNTNSSTGNRSIYFQAFLNYERTFANVHNIAAMILYNQDQFDKNAPDNVLENSLPKRSQGMAVRISYDYSQKYLAEINMGYNASENFAKGHRWGFFPSLALGWNISQENWFGSLKNVIHKLKIRGSFGLVGNADSGTRFLYLENINLRDGKEFTSGDGTTSYNPGKGPAFKRFRNEDIKWEVGHKLNVGLELGLFNALNITFDYFHEIRDDIFQQNNMIPNYMGTANATVYGNYGKVKNWGFEVGVDYGKQFSRDFSMQFKGNFSFARNKVLEYANGYHPDYPNVSIIGQSLNVNQGYVYSGHLFIDENEIANSPKQQISGNVAPGDIKYEDIPNRYGETDGIINNYDRVYMGHPTVPEIMYGFGPSFKYKNWDFSFFFQGAANVSMMLGGIHPFGSTTNRNVLRFVAEDHWSPDNQNIHASYPRLTQMGHGNNTTGSSYWLRNAAYLKLKNAEVGYSWKFLRAYVSGANLATFSPFKEWDPELGGSGVNKYPLQRTINVGVQLNF